LNRFGGDLYMDLIKVHIADDTAKAEIAQGRIPEYNAAAETARQIIAEKDCFSLKNLALNGNDIMEIGYKGREIGRILDLLLQGVIEGKCVNSPEALRTYLDKSMKE
ncbi:MAG: polynucleotide adenylyltransferase, partial [Firmicutes bacterium]|nr:polynucleotide adenylyltransferase [Bacillota bacterium]